MRNRLVAASDVVCGLSEGSIDDVPEAVYVGHGVDEGWLAPGVDMLAEPADLAAIPGPRAVYVGALSMRFDVEAVRALADSGVSVVLIGIAAPPALLDLARAHPRVYFLGERPPAQTPAYLRCCDVGIVPHTDEDFTRSMEPHKAYNYAAAGLPTVTLHAAHAPALDALVVGTRSVAEFVAAVGAAVSRGRLSDAQLGYARSLTWDRVAGAIMAAAACGHRAARSGGGCMSITGAVGRMNAIEAQLASLQTAFTPPSATAAAGASTPATASTGMATSAYGPPSAGTAGSAGTFSSQLATALGGSSAVSAVTPSGGVSLSGGVLPARAATMLTANQQQFASRLAADTGMDPGVVSAWMLAEESGGAAQSRDAAANNDWLNIGYTDSGTYGSNGAQWSDPLAAADATAGWLKGQNTIPGYGTASSGIQAVLQTAGQPPAVQIAALQQSGWASSGYPDLPGLYQQVAG